MVARLNGIQKVRGSTPLGSTTKEDGNSRPLSWWSRVVRTPALNRGSDKGAGTIRGVIPRGRVAIAAHGRLLSEIAL